MTRYGTALGLALTGLMFDVAGGTSPTRLTVDHACSLTAWCLGAAAATAALLSATGKRGPSPDLCSLQRSDRANQKGLTAAFADRLDQLE